MEQAFLNKLCATVQRSAWKQHVMSMKNNKPVSRCPAVWTVNYKQCLGRWCEARWEPIQSTGYVYGARTVSPWGQLGYELIAPSTLAKSIQKLSGGRTAFGARRLGMWCRQSIIFVHEGSNANVDESTILLLNHRSTRVSLLEHIHYLFEDTRNRVRSLHTSNIL